MELSLRQTIERIAELLQTTYRSRDLGNQTDVLGESVYILVSQQTRDTVYRRVFAALRQQYPRWRDVLDAQLGDLEEVLRPAGFQRRRARQLQALLRSVSRLNEERKSRARPVRGDLSLEFLRTVPDSRVEQILTALPGIGPKSARCIMVYALGRRVFPVDANIHRMFGRIGLIPLRGRKQDHDRLQSIIPPKLRLPLHINLIHHARAICRPKSPKCGDCVLVSFCKKGRARRVEGPRRVLDLFSGAGGLGRGFRNEGYQIVAAVESDRNAAQTYRFNNPGVPVIERSIGNHTTIAALARKVAAVRDANIIVAGPPCQGYSAAGGRVSDDPRNYLHRHVFRLARQLGARALVFENVPGLRHYAGRAHQRRIQRGFRVAGYAAAEVVTMACSFGVPQHRSRLFFVGIRARTPPEVVLAPTHSAHGKNRRLAATISLSGLLRALPRLGAGRPDAEEYSRNGQIWLNMSTMRHSGKVARKIRKIAPGDGPISYRRLVGVEARTLIAGHRALPIHPTLHRAISVREAAVIQGFPDNYRFLGARATQPLQVANAVPPPVAAAMARALRRVLR